MARRTLTPDTIATLHRIALAIRDIETRRFAVTLTAANILSHTDLDLPERSLGHHLRTYAQELSTLLGGRYHYFKGESPRTGRGPFGRYGGNDRSSKYQPGHLAYLGAGMHPAAPVPSLGECLLLLTPEPTGDTPDDHHTSELRTR